MIPLQGVEQVMRVPGGPAIVNVVHAERTETLHPMLVAELGLHLHGIQALREQFAKAVVREVADLPFPVRAVGAGETVANVGGVGV
jgi:hypothetical protein